MRVISPTITKKSSLTGANTVHPWHPLWEPSIIAIGIALLAGVSVAILTDGARQEAAVHPKVVTRIAFQAYGPTTMRVASHFRAKTRVIDFMSEWQNDIGFILGQ